MNTDAPDATEREELLDEVVTAYLKAVEAGAAPDRAELLARYPDLAAELTEFFSGEDEVGCWAAPLRSAARPTPGVEAPATISHWPVRAAPTPVPEFRLRSLGDYDVLGEVGRGGMGVVFKARQKSLDRVVALKMIRLDHLGSDSDLRRFRNEAEMVAHLDHPNIVPVYDVGECDGQVYFSMKLVEGGSLAEQLHRFRGDPRAAARLVAQVARAVHHAHQRGILHRDLKPSNVLLDADARPYITDFGLAKRLNPGAEGDGRAGLTLSGVVVGTPSYIAPEQAWPTRSGDRVRSGATTAADVYGLGAVLYELLTGRPPFRGPTALDIIQQVVSEEPTAPRQVQPGVPRDLETICLKCLEKGPARRYPSAAELADDLDRFLANESIRARPARAWERGLKWARRRPLAAALVLVSAAALVSLVAGSVVLSEYRRQVAELDAGAKDQQLQDLRRVQGMADAAQASLGRADYALAAGDLADAGGALDKVQGLLDTEPEGLARFREEHEYLRAEVGRRRAAEFARRQDRDTLARFVAAREEAFFAASQTAGADPAATRKQTREAARRALDVFGPGGTAPDSPHFSDAERAEVVTGRYALLLILADAVAEPLDGEDRRGQADEARRLLDRAAGLRAPTRAFHQQRARYLAALGDDAAAERRRAEALEPSEAVDHFLLGQECQGRDPARAAAHFDNAVRLQPDHFWARYALATCWLRAEQPKDAALHLTFCQERRKDFVWVYVLRGTALGEMGKFAAAEADFRHALTLRRDEEATYNLLVNRGAVRFRDNKHLAAVADFTEAIRMKPDRVPARVNLAEAYKALGRWDEAAGQLDEAVRQKPAMAVLYHARGRLHLERDDGARDLARALRDFEEAIRRFGPDCPPGERKFLAEDHALRGRILYTQGSLDDALPAFDAALAVVPGHLTALRWRGAARMKLKRYEGADRDFSAYLEKRSDADVYHLRGLARTARGDFDGAVLDFTRALDREKSAERYALRGWVHLFGDAPRPALRDFAEAIRMNREGGKEDAAVYAGHGYALVKLGRVPEAAADAERAVALVRERHDEQALYNAARVFAQAAGREWRDPRPAYAQASDRRLYHGRALELLRKVLLPLSPSERAEFWRTKVRTDEAFNPIRASAEFDRLATEVAGPTR